MKSVILSCSEGNRLRPITCSIPKSMLPVMGRPIAEHTVRLLHRHGINNITIAADYLAEEIKKHFSSVKIEDTSINFSPLQSLEKFFMDDDTIFISDSILTDMDLSTLISCFNQGGFPTIVTKPVENSCEYGSVHTDSSLTVTSYTRCPDFMHPSGSAFMGIAVIPKGTAISDCSDLQTLVEKLCGLQRVIAFTPQCYIKNVSDFESYHKCCRDFMDKKISLPFPCDEKAHSVWIDENATVMQGSIIVPPVYIGSGSLVSKGARIEAYTQIGRDVNVDCFAGIKRSIIMDNTIINEGSSLRGAIVGKGAEIGFESAAYEGSVIGFGTKLGRHCTLRSGVHVWPEKYIEDESTVCENVIWENTSMRSLFADGSANGVINREITPEFAATLGRSAVAILGKKIAVSEGGSVGGSMLKNALIAGIQSAGGKAYDLGEQPLPITRSAVRFYSLDGGSALSSYESAGTFQASLDIMNSLGADIEIPDLKRLEQFVGTGEAKRENAAQICEAEYLFEYKLYYLKHLINSTSGKPLGARLLINCPSPWAQDLLKSAAKDLNCNFTFTNDENESFIQSLKSGDYDFGVICDYKCETLSIVKNSGEKLSVFDYHALTSLIIMKSFPRATIFVPECAPDSIEIMAKKYGSAVRRTQVSPPHLMNELSKSNRKPFLHQFIYRFDAVGAIILLLDFLHTKNTTIAALQSEIPATHTVSTDISCPISKQTEILKELCANHKVEQHESQDAIRVTFENGWVLVVPKRTQSVINVISHAFSQEYAQEIADIFTDEITR